MDEDQSDVNVNLANEGYPEDERFFTKLAEKDSQDREPERPFESIIDCGQILTVSLSDICLDRHYGTLKSHAMDCMNETLRKLLGTSSKIIWKKLKFKQGDVIVMNRYMRDLPGKLIRIIPQRYLVVSSPDIDAIRERTLTAHWGRLNQVTIVPLIPDSLYQEGDRGVAKVKVRTFSGQMVTTSELAVCQEIYTYDWDRRHMEGPVGVVKNFDKIQEVLWDYLGL